MKRITITQEYDILLPKEYKDSSPEELVNDLNRMYDIHGKNIIDSLSAESDYSYTRLTHIDDEEVYCEDDKDGQFVSNRGYDIILDGQQLSRSDD